MLINRLNDSNTAENADERPQDDDQISKARGWGASMTEEMGNRVREIPPRW